MLRKLFYLLVVTNLLLSHGFAQDTIYLLEKNKPPFITIFQPGENRSDIAVIVCSGGSYGRCADQEEGIPAAKKLSENGITAFLLDYRPAGRLDTVEKYKLTFGDLQRAISFVRNNARTYNINQIESG